MHFYNIPPVKHLDLMSHGDRYFALAHLYLSDFSYRQHFLRLRKKPNCFITLDNGAAEHSLVTEADLLEAVQELQPDEVIAPDVLFDKQKTLKNLYSFVITMCDSGLLRNVRIFACPQGKTKQEWLDCYDEMRRMQHVSVIGLSKIAVPRCWYNATGDTMIAQSRNECVAELASRGWLTKPIHLLGMGEHTEFDYYLNNKIPNIRSSDSCYTILAAINNIDFSEGSLTRIPTTNEYFLENLSDEQIKLAIKNINYLKDKYKHV